MKPTEEQRCLFDILVAAYYAAGGEPRTTEEEWEEFMASPRVQEVIPRALELLRAGGRTAAATLVGLHLGTDWPVPTNVKPIR